MTSLVSVLKTATAIVSNTNSGANATFAVVHAVQGSSVVVFVVMIFFAAFARLENVFNVNRDGEDGPSASAQEMDELMFDER